MLEVEALKVEEGFAAGGLGEGVIEGGSIEAGKPLKGMLEDVLEDGAVLLA